MRVLAIKIPKKTDMTSSSFKQKNCGGRLEEMKEPEKARRLKEPSRLAKDKVMNLKLNTAKEDMT